MSGALASGAGVDVPGGDVGALQGAADYHYQLADGLEYHAGTMDSAATGLYHVWSGEAAGSYQALSSQVVAHYRSAAVTARAVGDALKRYAGELGQYQREGQQALRQAVYWLDQVHQWTTHLDKAQADVRAAQTAVQTAQSQVKTTSALGPGGDSAAGAATAQLAAARARLLGAQGVVRVCQEELHNAEHQLRGWQRRGGRIWAEAEQAAAQATGTLDATCVAPPPLAALPAPPAQGTGPTSMSHEQILTAELAALGLRPGATASQINAAIKARYEDSADPVIDDRTGLPYTEASAAEAGSGQTGPVILGDILLGVATGGLGDEAATAADAAAAAEGGPSLGDLYANGRVPTEAQLRAYAEDQGWIPKQSPTGPQKYYDENGVPRLTIKSGSARTPGSEGPHIEVRDPSGQRTDPFGSQVNRRSPDNHYPYRP